MKLTDKADQIKTKRWILQNRVCSLQRRGWGEGGSD